MGACPMSASPARRLAFRMLGELRRREAYAHEVLSALLSESDLSPADRSFATRLAYGAVSAEGTLDEVLSRYVKRPASVEPRVTDALRLAAYELLFLDTPRHAAVSQGVELAKEARPQAASLANAVLRRLAEDVPMFPFDDGDATAALARLTAHPAWLVTRLETDIGTQDARVMLEADNEPAPLYLANSAFSGLSGDELTQLAAAAGGVATPCPVPGCFEIAPASAAVSLAAVRDRRLLTTDAAAQLVVSLVPVSAGDTVVEVGAGRGTKSLLLQSRAVAAGGPANIVAVDKDAHKLAVLSRDAETLGVPNITTVAADMLVTGGPGLPAPGSADAVLVDAPCSGLGTLRRHPDKRWRLTPEDIEQLAALGSALLASSAPLVRVGGSLVYATCTVTHLENAAVIRSFLDSDEGTRFAVDPVVDDVPSEWRRFVTEEGYLQTLPERGGPDGHFAARLIRTA